MKLIVAALEDPISRKKSRTKKKFKSEEDEARNFA